jgi:hypothetical protein
MNNPKPNFHESGLNIIENPDGSFVFEWDPKDSRWEWMNELTDDQVRIIINQSIQDRLDQNDT